MPKSTNEIVRSHPSGTHSRAYAYGVVAAKFKLRQNQRSEEAPSLLFNDRLNTQSGPFAAYHLPFLCIVPGERAFFRLGALYMLPEATGLSNGFSNAQQL